MDAGRRAVELLDRRPELEDAVKAVLAVDAREDDWTFDDVPIDSGAFGELVAEGVVVDADGGGYQVAEPEAVRRVLADEVGDEATDIGEIHPAQWIREKLNHLEPRFIGLLVGSLAFLVVVRSYLFGTTFRGEYVVLSGNDPYYYRYWVETLLQGGGIDWGRLSAFPSDVTTGEPLFVTTLAFLSGLGGGTDATGIVLAVYPVMATVVSAVLLYFLTVRVTADRRVAIAAIAMLAVIPGHAFRTSIGYADHHAFDYVWLVLTALVFVVLLERRGGESLRSLRTWGLVGTFAVGVTGQILAWEGGPLLLIPIGFVFVGQGLLGVRDDRSPLLEVAAPLVGLWLAGGVTLLVHISMGWHETAIASTPLLMAIGGTGVTILSEGAYRFQRTARELLVAETVIGGLVIAGVWLGLPTVWSSIMRAFALATREGSVAEAQALFNAASMGFFLVFGPFLLVIAVASLVWATVRIVAGDDVLLVPATYAWFFLFLTLFQVRFVGELGPFAGLFAGLGFVWLAARVDLAQPLSPLTEEGSSFRSWLPTRPNARTVGYVLALFVLIGGIGLVQSAIKIEQLAYDDESFHTATWMANYAEAQGWEEPSESYVFSRWDRNRMYNYFVNGDSRLYSYALRQYDEFLVDTKGDAAYQSLESRVAFIVIRNRSADPPTMQALLHERHGSDTGRFAGTGHFRALYASEQGTLKVFHPVEGAVLTGSRTANASLTARTDVSIPGAAFTYERQTSANATGDFELRVAYPGTYTVDSDGETWEVTVAESAIESGERVQAES